MDTLKNNFSNYEQNDEMSLKEIVLTVKNWYQYLLSKWYIIIIAGFLGTIAGYLYSKFQEPVYTAELTFVLESGQKGGMAGYAGLASQFGIDMGGGGGEGVFEGENFFALVKSRLMIQKTLLTSVTIGGETKTLAEFYMEIYGWRKKWIEDKSSLSKVKFLPNSDPFKFSNIQNSLITGIHSEITNKHLSIDKMDKKASIISLKLLSKNELFSKYFVEVLSKEVSRFYVETKTKKSVDNLRILQHQADSIKVALNSSMLGAASSLDANPNPNIARQILRVPSQRRQGDMQMNLAILTQLVQNLEIAKMSLRTETPLIQIIDTPVLPLTVSRPNTIFLMLQTAILCSLVVVVFLIVKKLLGDLIE